MPPIFVNSKCTGCNECVKSCPVSALDLVDKKAVLARPGDCIDCHACETNCSSLAIRF